MSKPILTEEEADQELAEAVGKYDEQRPGLGHDFLDAIDKVLLRVLFFPEVWNTRAEGSSQPPGAPGSGEEIPLPHRLPGNP